MQDSDGKSCVNRMSRTNLYKEVAVKKVAVKKEVTVKEDGRLLVYYTFESTQSAQSSAADSGISSARSKQIGEQNEGTSP